MRGLHADERSLTGELLPSYVTLASQRNLALLLLHLYSLSSGHIQGGKKKDQIKVGQIKKLWCPPPFPTLRSEE